MRIFACFLCILLMGCVERPVVRQIPGASMVSVAPSVSEAQAEIPRLQCGKLSQADQLARSVVEERMKEGSYYAALAQVRLLPENVASVALLRADILREIDPVEAARWYGALLDTCEAGHARRGLGLLAATLGDYREARRQLQQAADEYPTEAAVRHHLGVVLMHLGQDEAARFNLRTASELAPADPQPRFSLMLLSLLRQDVTEWRRLSALWLPDSEQRQRLAQSCQRTLVIRVAQGSSGVRATGRCPIDPLAGV